MITSKIKSTFTVILVFVATIIFAQQVNAALPCPLDATQCADSYVKQFIQLIDEAATRVGSFGIGDDTDIANFSLVDPDDTPSNPLFFEVHGPSWFEKMLSHSTTYFYDRLFISNFSPSLDSRIDLYVNGNIISDAINLANDPNASGSPQEDTLTDASTHREMCVDSDGAIVVCGCYALLSSVDVVVPDDTPNMGEENQVFSTEILDLNNDDFFFSFTIDDHQPHWRGYVGLSADPAADQGHGLDYTFRLQRFGNNHQIHIYENEVDRGLMGSWANDDVLGIQRTSGVISYTQNGTVIYTSPVASSGDLGVDSTFYYTDVGSFASGEVNLININVCPDD